MKRPWPRGRESCGRTLTALGAVACLLLFALSTAPVHAWTKRVTKSCAECPCHAPGEPPPPSEEAHFTTYDEWPQSKHKVLDCLACHDSAERELLRTYTGLAYDIYTEPSELCRQCHFRQYYDWKAGGHRDPNKACTDVECHNPHDPSLPVRKVLPAPLTLAAIGLPTQSIMPLVIAVLPYAIFAGGVLSLALVTGFFTVLGESLRRLSFAQTMRALRQKLEKLLSPLRRALRPSRRASR